MLQRGTGAIINVASQLGQIGGVEMVHYSASKAGVIGLTKALAREVSGRGIRVNAIASGPIRTDMMAGDEWVRRKEAELPIGGFGDVEEVVPLPCFSPPTTRRTARGRRLAPMAVT
jgi:3-oxoacyl-[acyl-carrier protein] reductase